ncbi:hypothetical protein [Nesterenkonia sphaerica]|uniref:hypothetical protein n=1 Tax=Nesterenkonia sphaerica TaxID=1804988 RepID=UPI00140B63CE|nr:hypothetical protein [Nesterenkonia sphaerica]
MPHIFMLSRLRQQQAGPRWPAALRRAGPAVSLNQWRSFTGAETRPAGNGHTT